MFTKLTDFSYQRSALQALGFYLAWLVMGMLLGGLAGGIGGLVSGPQPTLPKGMSAGFKWGYVVSVPYSLAIGLAIVRSKRLAFGHYLLAVLGAVLACFGGSVLGLVIAAYISTKAKAE